MKKAKPQDVSVVDRPLMRPQSKIPKEVLFALMETAKNGKAVRLPLDGRRNAGSVEDRSVVRSW